MGNVHRSRLESLASMIAMLINRYAQGPRASLKGALTVDAVEAIFNVIAFAKPALELGPDVSGGWKSMLMTGGIDSVNKCALAGAKMRFAPSAAAL